MSQGKNAEPSRVGRTATMIATAANISPRDIKVATASTGEVSFTFVSKSIQMSHRFTCKAFLAKLWSAVDWTGVGDVNVVTVYAMRNGDVSGATFVNALYARCTTPIVGATFGIGFLTILVRAETDAQLTAVQDFIKMYRLPYAVKRNNLTGCTHELVIPATTRTRVLRPEKDYAQV